jgi:hypothetical protein
MKFNLPAILFLLFAVSGCSRVSSDKEFETFAIRQDSLFIRAYEHRDVTTYEKLLTEFLSKYNHLSAASKKQYSGQLSNAYYNFCCTYALVDNNKMALSCLKKSIESGYTDYSHIRQDKDLDNIRNTNEFKILVDPLRKVGDFMYILRKGAGYNPNEKREIPPFTYQSANDPNLTALRKAFNLDSVAGKANDISRILNLLHWIHNLIPHDGNHDNPVVKNAMSMIAECKKDNRGLNCRGLATVLNECYLSLGIKSRFITCLPKDSLKSDPDCHVINMVFCYSLNKWLWIDPTNDAYVMNENHQLLSIQEVRERLINDLPLFVNPDANWNHRNAIVKEDYLYRYMAKNLYMLECPVKSEYNAETAEQGKVVSYIRLLPLEYFSQSPSKTTGEWTMVYKTNNPDIFWQSP